MSNFQMLLENKNLNFIIEEVFKDSCRELIQNLDNASLDKLQEYTELLIDKKTKKSLETEISEALTPILEKNTILYGSFLYETSVIQEDINLEKSILVTIRENIGTNFLITHIIQEVENKNNKKNMDGRVAAGLGAAGLAAGTGIGGYKYGQNKGLKTGLTKGLTKGRAEGRIEGVKAGVIRGRTEGIRQGRAEGVAAGEKMGHAEGKSEGIKKGLTTGDSFERGVDSVQNTPEFRTGTNIENAKDAVGKAFNKAKEFLGGAHDNLATAAGKSIKASAKAREKYSDLQI